MFFTPKPIRDVRVSFHPWFPDGWVGGWEKIGPGCISETIGCSKLKLGRDIGWGVGEQCHGVTLI